MCIYNVVILSIVTLVLSLALRDNVTMKFVTVSMFMIIGTTMTQCLIFVPKVTDLSILENEQNSFTTQSSFSVNRSFCQICQNCIREKNSAKNLPLAGVEPSTLGLTLLLTSCLSCLTPVLDPYCLKD